MSILGNILWFVCGGLLSGLAWVLSGCLWCITIIGIPIGLLCFKFASLAFFPFGKEVVYGGGAVSLLANIVWLIVSGIPMAVGNAAIGVVCYITIIGIPFGRQFFNMPLAGITGGTQPILSFNFGAKQTARIKEAFGKIAKLALLPFGATVR